MMLGLHIATAHFAQPDNFHYRSFTPGIYFRTSDGFTGGFYRNSLDKNSAYAGWTFETESKAFAVTLGGVTGYPLAAVSPLVAPSFKLGEHTRIVILPKPPKGRSGAVHLSYEF